MLSTKRENKSKSVSYWLKSAFIPLLLLSGRTTAELQQTTPIIYDNTSNLESIILLQLCQAGAFTDATRLIQKEYHNLPEDILTQCLLQSISFGNEEIVGQLKYFNFNLDAKFKQLFKITTDIIAWTEKDFIKNGVDHAYQSDILERYFIGLDILLKHGANPKELAKPYFAMREFIEKHAADTQNKAQTKTETKAPTKTKKKPPTETHINRQVEPKAATRSDGLSAGLIGFLLGLLPFVYYFNDRILKKLKELINVPADTETTLIAASDTVEEKTIPVEKIRPGRRVKPVVTPNKDNTSNTSSSEQSDAYSSDTSSSSNSAIVKPKNTENSNSNTSDTNKSDSSLSAPISAPKPNLEEITDLFNQLRLQVFRLWSLCEKLSRHEVFKQNPTESRLIQLNLIVGYRDHEIKSLMNQIAEIEAQLNPKNPIAPNLDAIHKSLLLWVINCESLEARIEGQKNNLANSIIKRKFYTAKSKYNANNKLEKKTQVTTLQAEEPEPVSTRQISHSLQTTQQSNINNINQTNQQTVFDFPRKTSAASETEKPEEKDSAEDQQKILHKALVHLVEMGIIHPKEDKEAKKNKEEKHDFNPLKLTDEVKHFCLLFNVFHSFILLKKYTESAGKFSVLIDQSLVPFRNMIAHLGAYLTTEKDLFDTVSQIHDVLPISCMEIYKQYTKTPVLNKHQRQELIDLFNLSDQPHHTFETVIFLDQTPLFKTLEAFHAPKIPEDVIKNIEKTDFKTIILNTYIPLMKSIIRSINPVLSLADFEKKYSDHRSVFNQSYLFELQALHMLVIICGELEKHVKTNYKEQGLYHFLQFAKGIRNTGSHNDVIPNLRFFITVSSTLYGFNKQTPTKHFAHHAAPSRSSDKNNNNTSAGLNRI